MHDPDFVTSLGRPFLAHRLRRASENIVESTTAFLRANGFEAPARSVSTLLLLRRLGALGVTEIAWRLRLTHPRIVKLSAALAAAGLVRDKADPDDQRRRLITLTAKGRAQADRLEALLPRIAAALDEMFEEAGFDLFEAIEAFEAAAERRPLAARLAKASAEPAKASTRKKRIKA